MRAVAASLFVAVAVLAGCSATPAAKDYTPTWARFFLESGDSSTGKLVLPQSGVRVAVGARPVFSENDITNVELMQVDLGKCLMFQLTPSASRDLYRLTGSNQGRRLVLMINGEAVGARRIDAPLTDGVVYVFAEVPDASLPALVDNLKRSTVVLQKELAKR